MNELEAQILFNLKCKADAAWKRVSPLLVEQMGKVDGSEEFLAKMLTICEVAFSLGYNERVKDVNRGGLPPLDLMFDKPGPTV